ncbi:MAG: hypothetical protein NXY59_01105 [Aigarchaeota archaeon]|nr:hypothetical protein [Candidatus Pelearchaeum maunauluense]
MTIFELKPRPPYSMELQWRFYGSLEPQPEIYSNNIWRRIFTVKGKKIPVEVSAAGHVDSPLLRITAHAELTDAEKSELARKIALVFRLDDDLNELYDTLKGDKRLSRLFRLLYGFKPPVFGALVFEGIVRVITQQQVSLRVAYIANAEIVKRFGEKLTVNGVDYYDFPTAEALANAGVDGLRSCKLSRQKARYIHELAKAAIEGYDFERPRLMGDEEVVQELTRFPGLGRWSAELVLTAVLARPHTSFPDDLGVRRAVAHYFFNDKPQPSEKVRKTIDHWGRFKGWITFYLLCGYLTEAAGNRRKEKLSGG